MGIRPCAGENASFAEMLRYYEDPALHLRECREAGVGVVGKIGWGVCDELILAAGMESVAVRAGGGEHELADEYLEYAFTDKGKYLFERSPEGTETGSRTLWCSRTPRIWPTGCTIICGN